MGGETHTFRQQLDRSLSLIATGIADGAELHAVISCDRSEIADALYARVLGQIWVADGQLVTAPFSNQHVVFFEAMVVRLYDEWVTSWHKRKLKSGRAPGTNGQDDPGTDSEYEDVEQSEWVPREEILNCQNNIAHKIYVDDTTDVRALISPYDRISWARENATPTFTDTQAPQLGAGLALQAMVSYHRERATRREEQCICNGENIEIVGEACITEEGLVIQEPQRPGEQLHRINSVELLQGTGRASALPKKKFFGAVLRGQTSLEQLLLGSARWWRIGKWLSGIVLSLMTLYIRFRLQQLRKQHTAAILKRAR